MYKDLSDILICPECKGKLKLSINKEENGEVIDGKLCCDNNHNWAIKEGVINFGSKEQDLSNNWEEMFIQNGYEGLDKKILDSTPENMIRINEMTKDFIINRINNHENKVILDIATGRGMLLTELARKITVDAQVVCADLSFEVLKYDRLKVKKINPNLKINYIACDATNLPIKENSIDLAVSFHGIANMLDKIPLGVVEAKRVLKEEKSLLNCGTNIRENSQGYKAMKEWFNSQEIYEAEKVFTNLGFKNVHEAASFKNVELITIAEDNGQKCDTDLIPYEGEWFSVVVAECKK
ncbi:class I SAM-dependent methyltransferase [Clostridium omnivorum]|uniref:Methyltransferase domain-containing protein n=1 Tax=Clostridium omnivorum TaxID=1604902 RepID=A0ABQ5N1V7_9CLOT|nr:class I SAM-dependent methyltransferase [Clostridium sp. E14]GLC29183.1 hypothetical protein bsdE14_05930 [Clostridium sp. E14]